MLPDLRRSQNMARQVRAGEYKGYLVAAIVGKRYTDGDRTILDPGLCLNKLSMRKLVCDLVASHIHTGC